MDWSALFPALIALVGIPITYLLTTRRDDQVRREQWVREDLIRKEQQAREDLIAQQEGREWISQQWWQRKADTYTDLISALWEAHNDYRREYAVEIGEVQRKDRGDQSDQSRFTEIMLLIRQASEIGEFVVSEEVSNAFAKLLNDLEDNGRAYAPDWAEYYDNCAADTRKCLVAVRAAASRDLGLNRNVIG